MKSLLMSDKGKIKLKCKNCKNDFYARLADVTRGWGKFCSKSCKAKKQSNNNKYQTINYY